MGELENTNYKNVFCPYENITPIADVLCNSTDNQRYPSIRVLFDSRSDGNNNYYVGSIMLFNFLLQFRGIAEYVSTTYNQRVLSNKPAGILITCLSGEIRTPWALENYNTQSRELPNRDFLPLPETLMFTSQKVHRNNVEAYFSKVSAHCTLYRKKSASFFGRFGEKKCFQQLLRMDTCI